MKPFSITGAPVLCGAQGTALVLNKARSGLALIAAAVGVVFSVQAAVVINEIHYHPVERPEFLADGSPTLDLSRDVHEFIELYNSGPETVSLAGWRLSGDVGFDFPAEAELGPGQYVVVARDPVRLAAVVQYGLTPDEILGPYQGQLGNRRGTLRLRDTNDEDIDSVSFSAEFPWAISADALGAEDEWLGVDSYQFQYRGRSLERVNPVWSSNDPANWLASPAAGNPSPGRPNAVARAVPLPIVVTFSMYQEIDGEPMIRSNQQVRVECTFSATNGLGLVSLESFVDDISSSNEPRSTVLMAGIGAAAEGRFTALLPGRPDRSVVRFRIRAQRGAGDEVVSPRADDPFGWHAYFVTPVRTSTKPIYDCFISAASLNTLATNISQSPRRITTPDPPGTPRASWNATEAAIFVVDGVVYDIRMRHHGSRYNRNAPRNSFKWQFPRYARFLDREGLFITDKNEEHRVGHGLFAAAGLPTSNTRYIDLYLNANAVQQRLEQDEMDDRLAEHWAAAQAALFPGTELEPVGEFYKATGVIPSEVGEGPYGVGNFQRLPPVPPYWTAQNRYEWTYGLQMHQWKGGYEFTQMIEGLWAARGDTHNTPSPNVPAVRAYLATHFDIEASLASIAIRNWMCPWDDVTHNYFVWRRTNGKWVILPWDFDAEFGVNQPSSCSIFVDEVGDLSNTSIRGPNFLKDSFFKAFREEYKRVLFRLNNTLLSPTNFTALGFDTYRSFAEVRTASVNAQLNLGPFRAPLRPTNAAPVSGQGVLPPAFLQSSPYLHAASPAPAQASTTWSIRAAQGSYRAPVFKTTSTSNLTSLPIPFDSLVFGESYSWKCSYTDTNGHPSPDSLETSFIFGAAPVPLPLINLDALTLWRYNQSGSIPAPDWMAPDYDDTGWPQGPPLFGASTATLPEPIRTPLQTASTKLTFYFRTTFQFAGDPGSAILNVEHIVDDGVVLYLNGVEVLRTGMNPGPVTATTVANRNIINATNEGPFILPAASLMQGANVLAAEVHQASAFSTDVAFGLKLFALVPPAPGAVVLNEILAENRTTITNDNRTPDYIELLNNTDLPQSLNGLTVSDDVLNPGKYAFPPNTVLEPRTALLLWCDNQTNSPDLHSGFALDNDGQTVALFNATPGGYVLSDVVTFGLQLPDYSIGRVPHGIGSWELNVPSPAQINNGHPVDSPSQLKINEWMATDANGSDWFELFNPQSLPVELGGLFVSDTPSKPDLSRIASLSFIGPNGYRQFIADENPSANARHVDFRLSANGDSLGLYHPTSQAIDTLDFGPQVAGVSEGRLPDGHAFTTSFPGSPSPEAPNHLPITSVLLNELVPDIELYNVGSTPVDLSGWWLSDDPNTPNKYRIPDLTMLGPGDYWAVQDEELPFSLDPIRGGRILLSHDGLYRVSRSFGPYAGYSYGIVPTSVGPDFAQLESLSMGASNSPPLIGPVVLSEIQYHPTDLPGDDDDYEYLELANLTDAPANLFLPDHPLIPWRLRDAVSFRFPSNTTLLPGERILVLGFDPATNHTALSNFLAAYQIPEGQRLFGPYSGKLDNAGDSVELVEDRLPILTPGPDYGDIPTRILDRVRYGDAPPWPLAADGSGPSLQKSPLAAYGNDPAHWFASGVSPGVSSQSNAAPDIVLQAPMAGASFNANLSIRLTASVTDSDGTVRRVVFYDSGTVIGESLGPVFSILWFNPPLGARSLSAKAIDNLFGSTLSAAVPILLTNDPPTVQLEAPPMGSAYILPTNIVLEAQAGDSDGVVARVEFFDNSVRLGEDLTAPYSFVWTNARPGSHALTARAIDNKNVSTTSTPVLVTANRLRYIAYSVPPATIGGQVFGGGLGMDFDVLSPIVVPSLGIFDSGSDGLGGTATLTVQIYARNGNAGTVLATTTFNAADSGTLLDGSRFKPLALPLILSPGSYTVVGYGHTTENPNGNPCCGPKTWTTDDGGGLIGFVGVSRYGSVGPGTFPTTLDTGPVDRYASGTFEYTGIPSKATLFGQPTNMWIRPTRAVTNTVVAAGQAPLAYQWYFNGAPLSGQNTPSLILTNGNAQLEGAYFVIVSNALGTATSAVVSLSLLVEAIIVQLPISQTVVSNGPMTLSVIVTNTATLPITYRWRRNNQFIPNATFTLHQRYAFYSITNVQAPFTNYAVVVSNVAQSVATLSSSAFLTILADADKDALPNIWESAFGFLPDDESDADDDPDNDGLRNLDEYLAGTNPTNNLSVLQINRLELSENSPFTLVEFTAVSNRTYTVQFKNALSDPTWLKLMDAPAHITNRTVRAPDPESVPTRFYRLVTPQQPP